MKHIVKQAEPEAFVAWKARKRHQPDLDYDDLVGALKQEVKRSLLQEQGYICCYCERRIRPRDSHIEHLRPQSDPESDSLDYQNLLCSCQRRVKKGAPRHCGNLKGYWYDPQLLVSPLDPGCETRFAYNADGRIKPADPHDRGARETIKHLGLGIPKLNNMRAQVIEAFLDPNLDETELQAFVSAYLQLTPSGKYSAFWTTIRYLFAPDE